MYALPSVEEERSIVSSWIDAAPGGFDAFYRRFQPALRDFCRTRLANAGDADDACQEALMRAYSASGRFRTTARVWPWLATIAANVCIDINRKKRDVTLDEWADAPDQDADPDDLLARRQRNQLVADALQALPTRYRTSVYLRDVEGWSYSEIATLERTTTASVRSTLMRGRKALRTKLREVADGRGLWPLPAIVPGPWLRWRARRASTGPLWMRPELADMLSGYLPALTNAAVAALVALSLAFPDAGAVGSGRGAGAPPQPIASVGAVAGSSGGGGAARSGSGTGSVDTASTVVAIEPVPGTEALVSRDGELDPNRETLEGKVFARVGEGPAIGGAGGVSVACDKNAVRQAACDSLDELPGAPDSASGDR